MDYDTIALRRKHSGAWRLLSSDNVALTLGFLSRIFIDENVREIAETDLINRLDDELYALNQRLGEDTYPKSAKAYLADWSAVDKGWLRRYYPHGSDEPHYDATTEVELAASWVRDLAPRDFVGTESRLSTILELLRQMVYGSETDAKARRAELLRRRAALDDELARLDRGEVALLAPVAQQERYQQFATMARDLLADFRQVEENFRRLDRNLREKIAAWDGSKAELLDEVLGSRNTIAGSPQGQSFSAFFDFLLSPERREEFSELLHRVGTIESLDTGENRLRHIHHDWHAAGERTQATVRLLSEQLRKFLDDQAWLENRRIMDLISSVQSHAIELKYLPDVAIETELEAPMPSIVLPTERPLFTPQRQMELDSAIDEAVGLDLDDSVLYEHVYVDPRQLARSVRASIGSAGQIGLAQIVEQRPLTHGLAELVTYMTLKDEMFDTVFDDEARDTVHLLADDGLDKTVRLPRVTFVRTNEGAVR